MGRSPLIIKGFFYSTGKINHDLLLAVVPIVLAFSGWGWHTWWIRYGRFRGKQTQAGGFLATYIAGIDYWLYDVYCWVCQTTGRLALYCTQATLGHLFNQFFVKGRQDLLATWVVNIDNRMLWELLDYATVLFEIGFLMGESPCVVPVCLLVLLYYFTFQ
ncbi:MAG: hypothetical protein U5J63_12995 [Fodinibius sp.]|nr:hypothetical protein [Fodinibius sp.]